MRFSRSLLVISAVLMLPWASDAQRALEIELPSWMITAIGPERMKPATCDGNGVHAQWVDEQRRTNRFIGVYTMEAYHQGKDSLQARFRIEGWQDSTQAVIIMQGNEEEGSFTYLADLDADVAIIAERTDGRTELRVFRISSMVRSGKLLREKFYVERLADSLTGRTHTLLSRSCTERVIKKEPFAILWIDAARSSPFESMDSWMPLHYMPFQLFAMLRVQGRGLPMKYEMHKRGLRMTKVNTGRIPRPTVDLGNYGLLVRDGELLVHEGIGEREHLVPSAPDPNLVQEETRFRFADGGFSFPDPPQRHLISGTPERLRSNEDCQLVVNISVDRNGKVTTATVDRSRTNCSDAALFLEAESYARTCGFSKAPDAPASQKGFVLYDFNTVADPITHDDPQGTGYPTRTGGEDGPLEEPPSAPVEPRVPSSEAPPLVPRLIEREPDFPGGPHAWLSFVSANIEYIPAPPSYLQRAYEVRVNITLDSAGKLIDVQPLHPGRSPEHEAEALRICRLPRKWESGIRNGMACTTSKLLWVGFPSEPKHPVTVEFLNGTERLLFVFPRLYRFLTKPTPCTMAFLLTVDRTGAVTEVNKDKRCDCTIESDVMEAQGIASRYRFEPLSDGPKEQKVRVSWSTMKTQQEEDAMVYAPDSVDEKPQFPGGEQAMKDFLRDSLQYPEKERAAGRQGKVRVGFEISGDGSVRYVSAGGLAGPQVTLDMFREAERVVRAMPPWTPGKINGRAVNVRMELSVEFKLP